MSRKLSPLLAAAAIAASLLGPGVALASPVALRADIAAPGGRLTLGDVFNGVDDQRAARLATGGHHQPDEVVTP